MLYIEVGPLMVAFKGDSRRTLDETLNTLISSSVN